MSSNPNNTPVVQVESIPQDNTTRDTYTLIEQRLTQALAQYFVPKNAREQELQLLLSSQNASPLLEKTGVFKQKLQLKNNEILNEESELAYLVSEWQQQAILEQQEQEVLSVQQAYKHFISEEEEQDEDFAEDLEEDLDRRKEEELETTKELEEAWQEKRSEEQHQTPPLEAPDVDRDALLKPVLDPTIKGLSQHVIKPLVDQCEEVLTTPVPVIGRALK